ncbi:MAG: FAD-dependent oxidoreductase [Saprospiraceae bacterium]|nr:FAD-dependent oxidoreductase [Saprospiraceae bacterium]
MPRPAITRLLSSNWRKTVHSPVSWDASAYTCETGCNRTHIDTTVGIHSIERYIGDLAIEKGWQIQFQAKPTGKRVLVIGAGPAGLSAAYHLARMGHTVEIYEAHDAPADCSTTACPLTGCPQRCATQKLTVSKP